MRKIKISKEDILKEAIRLMAEKGIEAVSMREIANNLSITKPVIYYYFKDKEDLIKQVFSCKARELEDLDFNLGQYDTAEDVIYGVLKKHHDFLVSNPEAVKCFIKIIDAPHSSPIRKHALQMRAKNIAKIKKRLSLMAKEGKIKQQDIEWIIHMILALLSYHILEMRLLKKSINLNLLKKMSSIAAAGINNAKHMFFIVSLSLISSLTFAQISVQEAVQIAMAKNVSVLNAIENQKIYQQRIREYWGGVYPSLSLSASYTRNIEKQTIFFGENKIEIGLDNSYTATLDLNQVLFAGGKVGTGIEIAKIYADVANENLLFYKSTIKRTVKQTYYSVALMREMAKIQKETLEISRQHLSTIKEQFSKGLKSDLEVMRQEVEFSNNEPNLIKAENAYNQGLLALKNIIGLDSDEKIEISWGPLCQDFSFSDYKQLYATAIKKRSDYQLAYLSLELAEKQLRLEKAGHWPSVYGFASKSFSGQSNFVFPSSSERSWSAAVGVKLNMPIFSGFSVSARIKQAEGAVKIAQRNLDDLKRKIRIDLKSAILDLDEAKKRVDSQKTSVSTARKALETMESRFKNGLASQLELNDAVLALNRSETLLAQAEHDYCSNLARLEWELGD